MAYGFRQRIRCAWRELTKREEPSPPPPLPYSRLILICGMPRTGTSALASYVGSHPDVRLVVGGDYWKRCESNLVRDGNIEWKLLNGVMKKLEPWRVLIKQPWLETNMDFFPRVPGARVIVCFRQTEGLFDSWFRTWTAGREGKYQPQKVYEQKLIYGEELVSSGALRIDMEKLGSHIAKKIGRHLDLDHRGFDAERIKKKWREDKERQWVMENAVWQPTK